MLLLRPGNTCYSFSVTMGIRFKDNGADVRLFDNLHHPVSTTSVMTFSRGRDVMTTRYLVSRGRIYFLEVPKAHYDPLRFEFVGQMAEEIFTNISRVGDNATLQSLLSEGDEANFYGPCHRLSLNFLPSPTPNAPAIHDSNLHIIGLTQTHFSVVLPFRVIREP